MDQRYTDTQWVSHWGAVQSDPGSLSEPKKITNPGQSRQGTAVFRQANGYLPSTKILAEKTCQDFLPGGSGIMLSAHHRTFAQYIQGKRGENYVFCNSLQGCTSVVNISCHLPLLECTLCQQITEGGFLSLCLFDTQSPIIESGFS